MAKRKLRPNLWLNRPKKRRQLSVKSGLKTPKKYVCSSRTCTPSTIKYGIGSPFYQRNSSHKRICTPLSNKKSRKRLILESGNTNTSDTTDEFSPIFDDEIPSGAKEFVDIATDIDVINTLTQVGLLIYFTQFFCLVKEGKYPLKNIGLLLWIETVKWYKCVSAQSMWYFDETMRFWRAGYRLFHGKFISFMSGPKCLGQLLSTNKTIGIVYPEKSDINFAVPSRNTLLQNSEHDSIIKPGLISQTINAVKSSKQTDVYMLCVDGKKVTPGLDADFGDVDMFGFENKPTVHECKYRAEKEKHDVDETIKCLTELKRQPVQDKQNSLLDMIRFVLYLMTQRVQDARIIKDKQEYGLEKLKERAGKEWRSSKYQYAISGIQAFLYRLRQYVDGCLNNMLKLCHLGSEMSDGFKHFSLSNVVNPLNQANMRILKPYADQSHPTPTQFIKQRSAEWNSIRELALLTGSTFHNAIGLRSLKEQKSHFDKVILKKPYQHSDTAKTFMEHGTKNEPNAVATLVSRFMPLYYPELVFTEEGCYMIGRNRENFIEVSPDGSLRSVCNETGKEECVCGIEIKCPYPKLNQSSLYYKVPWYYVCQCLTEMKALKTDKLIFVCYTEESTTFFKMEFDEQVWNFIQKEAEDLYDVELPHRPSRLSPNLKSLKETLDTYVREKVQLLVELPSAKLQSAEFENASFSDYPFYLSTPEQHEKRDFENIADELDILLNETRELIETGHQLSRKKASEVMVWVLSNKDRIWSHEIPNSVPIAYGLKDYKFSAQSLREACDFVLNECKSNGLNIPLLAFDGQWYSVMVRDGKGNPLTVLQLQKDIWSEVCKMKKKDIIEAIKDINKPDKMQITFANGKITVVSKDRAFKCIRYRPPVKQKQKKIPENTDETCSHSLTWLPESVLKQIEEKGDQELLKTLYQVSREIESSHNQDQSLDDANEDQRDEILEESEQLECVTLSEEDYTELSDMLKQKNKSSKWTPDQLKKFTETAESIKKFTVSELDIIADYLKTKHQITYKKSWQKSEKVNAICKEIGDKTSIEMKQRMVNGEVPSLKKLCLKVLNGIKVKKASLTPGYASYIFPDKLDEWRLRAPVPKTIQVDDEVFEMEWYSIPELNTATKQLLCKCLDSHHLMTNLRIKTSTAGLKNVSPEAWKKVARSYETNLTPSMVEDLVDKQSNAFAQTHFSKEVEDRMIENGDISEASFCKLIREWYEAEDCPALSVKQRFDRWLALRHHLIDGIDFSVFPPKTQFINGLSVIAFEGFLTGIDTKLQLYSLCKGSYCVRTASSLPAETCVGGIQDLNLNNHVAVKAKDVPKIMASLTEIMAYKCNPERGFYMQTSRAPVYPVVEGKATSQQKPGATSCDGAIVPSNHPFDDSGRRRLKPQRKSGTVTRNLDAAPRGTQPMRREFFKCDESKIDPLKRAGFNLNEK